MTLFCLPELFATRFLPCCKFHETQLKPGSSLNPHDGEERDDVNLECKAARSAREKSCRWLSSCQVKICRRHCGWGKHAFESTSATVKCQKSKFNHIWNFISRSTIRYTTAGPEPQSRRHRRGRWLLLWVHHQGKPTDIQGCLETQCKLDDICAFKFNLKLKSYNVPSFHLSDSFTPCHLIHALQRMICVSLKKSKGKVLAQLYFIPDSIRPGSKSRYIFYALILT